MLLSVGGGLIAWGCDQPTRPVPTAGGDAAVAPATEAEVRRLCAACHAYPPADSFPRSEWRIEVKRGFDFFRQSTLQIPYPSLEAVTRYYESRAPERLNLPDMTAAGPCPVRLDRTDLRLPGEPPAPAVSHLNLVRLSDVGKPEVLVCDMRGGRVLLLDLTGASPRWRVLAEVPFPAHAEVVDLDGDGIKDVLVACLGNFAPTDDKVGSVVWLRGRADGSFTPVTLLEGVGRVADVQAADFDGDGKLDLVVAAFGWRRTGEIIYLANRTTHWAHPRFVPTVLDDRHGTIHVPVSDIDGDGKPDFVALISQEHETIVAFLGRGDGTFRKETIYQAPHPAYGSSGIQLVDLNGDGKIDVLYTNGDVLDSPDFLKPYHGVQWLENRGAFPFTHHPLGALPGVHRAVAGDLDGDGRLDVVAVSLLPPPDGFAPRRETHLDSVILLKQSAPGVFSRHVVERDGCDHVACVAGDIFGDGRVHFMTGNFCLTPQYKLHTGVTVWKCQGR